MKKYGILFVDDEPNVLRGLRRFCRAQRHEWDMYFAEGGNEALEILETNQIGVVVSDMRMPEVNGADLFEEISNRWPGIIRIMLSGEAEFDQTIRTVGRSHRFLAKPCDPESLIDAISIPLRKLEEIDLGPIDLDASFMDRLRTPPQIFDALMKLLDLPDATTDDVTEVIKLDASLSMRVLQLVNSAYFGRPVKTLNIRKAVEILGLDRIRILFETQRLGNHGLDESENVADFVSWVASTGLAKLSRKMAMSNYASKDVVDLAYAASLFADLGTEFENQQTQKATGADPLSAYMTALLGLPETLTDALEHLAQEDAPSENGAERAQLILKTIKKVRNGAA